MSSRKESLARVKTYLLDRFNEPSTWRGLALLVASCGAYISPDQTELFIFLGLFASGLIGAALPDKKDK